MTDENGSFTIQAKRGDVLKISLLGYKESAYTVGAATSGIEIVLLDDTQLLEESVVVGYGTMQRRDITSSIATFKPADEGERDFLSPDAMLQGHVAGVNISSAFLPRTIFVSSQS